MVITNYLLISKFVTSPTGTTRSVGGSIRSRGVVSRQPTTLSRGAPSAFSRHSGRPISSIANIALKSKCGTHASCVDVSRHGAGQSTLGTIVG